MTRTRKVSPLLMKGPLVIKTLAGKKTQTRRVCKQPHPGIDYDLNDLHNYGQPGDLLYVRESFAYQDDDGCNNPVAFMADHPGDPKGLGWKPGIHMPRDCSRLTLELTAVRVERLQDMKQADALAEGIDTDILPADDHSPQCMCYVTVPDDNHAYVTAIDAFKNLWDRINAKRGYGWDSNPWVVALEYKAHIINVDEFLSKN